MLLFPQSLAFAGDAPFTSPNNWGATGLMETPTARVLENGKFRVGVGYVDPYLYYYGAVSPLRGLEIDGRITEELGTEVGKDNPTWQGYGNNKDKAVDLKYQFLREGKYWPALALGIMDPHGTRLHGGQYLVASKQIFPFDFTIGFGNGKFGKKRLPSTGDGWKLEIFENPREWWNDGQFFGGIEFHPTQKLSFMVEYNPIKYEIQTSGEVHDKYFKEAVPSKINVGMRYKPFDWAQLDLSPSPLSRQKTWSLKVHSMPARLKVKFFFRMMSSSGTGVIHSHLGAALPRSMAERWLWVTPPLPIVC